MKTRTAYFPSDLKTREISENDENHLIEGYFAVFNQRTELWPGCFEEIAPGTFDHSLKENDIRCLFDHKSASILGRTGAETLTLSVDDHGLFGAVRINPSDTEAMNVYQRVKRGDIAGCSFGFNPIDEQIIDNEDGTTTFIVREANLVEVSIVTFPAYPQTEIEARKADVTVSRSRMIEAKKKQLKERMNKWH